MTRQLTLVFLIDPDIDPEICVMQIERLADSLQSTIALTFEVDGDVDSYLNEKELTHLIVRDLDGTNEKAIIARRFNPELISTEQELA